MTGRMRIGKVGTEDEDKEDRDREDEEENG